MWTEEQIEQLVDLYKQYPLLWDVKDKFYTNRGKKQDALKKISASLNIGVVEVERKLNILLTQFRRTHRKVLRLRKNGMGEDDIEKNIWYGYKWLLFLEDRFNTLQKRNILQNQNDAEKTQKQQTNEIHPNNVERTNQMYDIQTANIHTASILRREPPPPQNDRLQRVTGCQVNDAFVLMNDVTAKRQLDKDEYDLYGEQIALKLRKMDELTRIHTQHRINCVIHEVEMNLLKERYGYPPHSSTLVSSPSHEVSSASPLCAESSDIEISYDAKSSISATIKSDVR